jgi:hypothetical protein
MRSLIARFEEAARTNDAALNADLLAEDVRLYGVPWKPFEGKAQALAVFTVDQFEEPHAASETNTP